ncbi:hypothetical protein M8J76_005723 [Diaphorina citri]|nr:hypothetical protein M8J76_005723 [Diaphorina citri]
MMLDTCGNLNATGSPLTTLLSQFLLTMMTKSCEFGNVAYPDDRSNDVLDNHVKIDMVVVGSGSSGSVIANRLSEVSKWNVLLIEAGDSPLVTSNVPALFFHQMKTSIDWAYETEKQPGVCEGLQNGVCNVPRGKALGGSSNMNAMMYLVGNPNDYNSWGNSDWNFKNVEKYFHKSFDDFYYAGYACEPSLFNKTMITELMDNAGKELNLHKLKHKNRNITPNKVGIVHIKTNIKNGERLNVAKAFLAPIKDRPNLFVMKNTLVTKILLENKKATGVQVYKDDKYYTIKFSKELIISAGAVNTPQLLFQSGIGDEELLKKENIDVKMNLPSVGKYLYDHPLFVVPVQMNKHHQGGRRKNSKKFDFEKYGESGEISNMNKIKSKSTEDNTFKNNSNAAASFLDEVYNYITKRTGSLAGIGAFDYIAFLDTTAKSPEDPNIEMIPFFYKMNDLNTMEMTLNFLNWPKTMVDAMLEPLKKHDMFLFVPMFLKPKSFGNITVSKDVFSRPKIFLNYYHEEEDLNTFVKAVRIIQKFVSTKSFKEYNSKIIKIPDSVCDGFHYDSDDYWKCTIKRRSSSYYHLSSTARMGDNILTSVVNYKLQVHGLENVRIADASVMPYTVNANIHATCVMIGEKCADLIKQYWKEKV